MSNIATRVTGTYSGDSRAFVYADVSGQPGRASVTLDMSKFTAAQLAAGSLPSGIVLGKIDATGLYGPYDPAATDGRKVPAGFLWNAFTPTGTQEAAPLWFGPGAIKESKLPTGSGLDAGAKTALGAWFKFF
ncbi:head decoration protein [Nocardia pseudobrasiliensis]|uniref:Bacteriophage lambda head decoration protein D n=1 Tax=Nocardia pseudobrasiliensis TaxID=45979 RepID=A0A370I4U4_9NOCA|nr:head decoration protein [Nocardia pseudobrasiliensis]RDI65753.1 bacteriophage lambda head decoration protein D [Nocardia pseudobrasiliensis]